MLSLRPQALQSGMQGKLIPDSRKRDLPDQVADLLGDGRTAALALAAQARPMFSEAFALPADHRARLHDNEGLSPAGPGAGEPRPEDAVGGSQMRTSPGSLIDCELVS